MRTTSILVMVLAIASAGCASPGGAALPVCDGKHLRPANPHGSVLDPAVAAPPAASPAEPAIGASHPSCDQ
jgi:type IV secretion system protein VirB7